MSMQKVNKLLGEKKDRSSCELLSKQSAPDAPASPGTSRVCEHGRIRYQCKDCIDQAVAAEAEAAGKAEAEAAAAAKTAAVAKAKAEADAEAAEVEAKVKAEAKSAAGEAKVVETEADAAAAEGKTSPAERTTTETEGTNPKTSNEAGADDDTSSGAALFKQYAQDTKAAGRAPVPTTNDPTDSSEVEHDKAESNAGSMFLTCSGLDAISSRTAVILSATPS